MHHFYEGLLIAGGAFFASWLFLVAIEFITIGNEATKAEKEQSNEN